MTALSSPARLHRLVRIAEEATKQCDRTIVPFVEGPKSTEDFLRGLRGETLSSQIRGSRSRTGRALSRRVTRKRGGSAGRPGSRAAPRREAAVVAIGPEGGFAPAEISLFEENLALFLSLGPRILRLETAVVVALARLVDPA